LSKSAKSDSRATCGTVSGDGRNSRCCTLEEFSQDCDSVSVTGVQEKCDEKGVGAGLGAAQS
jgi:hypothetical protein